MMNCKHCGDVLGQFCSVCFPLRDQFAMAALTGLLPGGQGSLDGIADKAYKIADAMLKAKWATCGRVGETSHHRGEIK